MLTLDHLPEECDVVVMRILSGASVGVESRKLVSHILLTMLMMFIIEVNEVYYTLLFFFFVSASHVKYLHVASLKSSVKAP